MTMSDDDIMTMVERKKSYPLHISEPLDYQCQRLLIVPHFTQQKDHLWN